MEDSNMNLEEGEIDLFDSKPQQIDIANINNFTYYNYLESQDSSQDSHARLNLTPQIKNNIRGRKDQFFDHQRQNNAEETKKLWVQVNVSDVCSLDSRSTGLWGRPRSSSQPTENDKMIKEPFNLPRKRNKDNLLGDNPLKRIETMSNHSHSKFKPRFSVDGCSLDGEIYCKKVKEKNYRFHKLKERKLLSNNISKSILNQNSRQKRKKNAFRIKNINEIVLKLNTISNVPLYVDLLFTTLKERNKSLLRNVVDELGMQTWTEVLREVALIQENGGMKVKEEGRYKTLGGVFFYLVRKNASLTKQAKDRIFKSEKKYLKAKKNLVDDLEKLLTFDIE